MCVSNGDSSIKDVSSNKWDPGHSLYCKSHSHFNFCADCFVAGKAALLQKMREGKSAKRADGGAAAPKPRKRAKRLADKLRKVHDAAVKSFLTEAAFQGLGPQSELQYFGYFAAKGPAGKEV